MKNVDCFKEEEYCIIDLIILIVVNVNVLKHQVNVVISIDGFISPTFFKDIMITLSYSQVFC